MASPSQGPTRQAQSWAVATIRTACRTGRLSLDEAEERLQSVYDAASLTEVYGAIAGLPHPPAPLVLDC